MSQVNIHIDPLTTNCVLKHLGLAIDEIKLLRSIDSLKEQVRLGNTLQIEPSRREFLAAELRFLNKQLQSVRDKAHRTSCRKADQRGADAAV